MLFTIRRSNGPNFPSRNSEISCKFSYDVYPQAKKKKNKNTKNTKNLSLLEMKVQAAGLLLGWISDIPNPGERKRPTSFSPLQEKKTSHNQSLGRQIGTTVFVFSPSTPPPLSGRGLTLRSTVTTHKYLWVLYCKREKMQRKVTVKSLVPLQWKAALCMSINLLCKWSLKLCLV